MEENINVEEKLFTNQKEPDQQSQEEIEQKIENINAIEKIEEKKEIIEKNDENIKNIIVEEEKEEYKDDMENLNINDLQGELNKNINIQEEVKEMNNNKEDLKEIIIKEENEGRIIPVIEEEKEKNDDNNINKIEEEHNENNNELENKESIINKVNNMEEDPIENNINISVLKEKENNLNNTEQKNDDKNIIQEKETTINNINVIGNESKENNIIEETVEKQKNKDNMLGFLNVGRKEIKKIIKKPDNEKEEKEKREEININSTEVNKLKEIFLNSFILQSKSEKGGSKLDNDIRYKEEMNEDKNKQKNDKIYQEIIKFKGELNLKKKLKKFNLFYCKCKTSDDKSIYKLGKVLVYTYRKNFPKIKNYKNKKTFTTDAWWGCMVRCGQMILSRGIYRLLKKKHINTEMALYYTVPLFGNYPIRKEKLHPYFQGMINKYIEMTNLDESPDKEIKEFYPPFSIKTLCDVGEIYERTAGEWFSDVIITGVFRRISEYYNLFINPELNVKIMTFQSCIEMKDILEACFIQKKYDKKNKEHIHYQGKYYYYNKMGIIFINVRVGLDKIPKEYYDGIKKLFTLKECIGIIGGKTRLAYYFIGYNEDDDSLLYLDPHVTIEADKEINIDNILSKHANKEIHLLKMSKMSTAFTIGFCFRTYDEFLNMYEFWMKAKNDKLPILGIVKQSIEYDEKNGFDEEDYSPTYEDKDEDDF